MLVIAQPFMAVQQVVGAETEHASDGNPCVWGTDVARFFAVIVGDFRFHHIF